MSKIKNKTIGTFGTLGSDPFSEHARSFVEKVIRFFENNWNKVEREFICRGAISPKIIEKFRKMTKEGLAGHHSASPENEKRWAEAERHPDKNDIENSRNTFKGF